ncbi:MAG: D-alanine--D-alanine ligase A, partial [Ktedonobacteraceae bacterium]|nr:D-alanine--D-alanine ligase A [Ktedonobacteraceae bacterium]
MKKRIGVVFGGRSSEHDVSLASAELVIRSLDPQRYEIIPIAISRQGDWFWNIQPQQLREAGMEPQQLREASMGPQQGIVSAQRLIRSQSIEPTSIEAIDVFFPVLHGPNGEDGTIQGLFEMANVPYVGCGVLASAIGMDKEMMKKLFQMAGLPVVASLTIKRRDWEQAREDILNRIEQH